MAIAKRQEIELILQSLTLQVTSPIGLAATSRHAVTTELIWARNAFQSRGYTRIVGLSQGACVFTDADWIDAVLMKETVLGRFGLRVRVSQALSDSAVSKILQAMAKAAATSVGVALEKSLDKPMGKTLSAPVDYVASLFAAEAVSPIAEAVTVVDPKCYASGGTILALPLVAPAKVTRAQSSAGKTQRPRKQVLAKGEANGEVTLSIGLL